MDKNEKIERRYMKNKNIRELVDKAKITCDSFFQDEYVYSKDEAVEELGLDEELIEQLIEDYVSQIIKSVMIFEEYLYELQSDMDAKKPLDFTKLKDLAHRNLGVVKNLRIKDAEKLLDDLMKKDDLEYLFRCIEVLRACAIKMKPLYAFNTIKLIEIKSTF